MQCSAVKCSALHYRTVTVQLNFVEGKLNGKPVTSQVIYIFLFTGSNTQLLVFQSYGFTSLSKENYHSALLFKHLLSLAAGAGGEQDYTLFPHLAMMF